MKNFYAPKKLMVMIFGLCLIANSLQAMEAAATASPAQEPTPQESKFNIWLASAEASLKSACEQVGDFFNVSAFITLQILPPKEEAYQKKFSEIVAGAQEKISNSLISIRNAGKIPCVVFDIDDTTLNRQEPYKKEPIGDKNFEFFKAIRVMLDFYQWCCGQGVKVFFTTARTDIFNGHDAKSYTVQNLKEVGYTIDDKTVFCVAKSEYPDQAIRAKKMPQIKEEMREKIVNQGYAILATFDDLEEILFMRGSEGRLVKRKHTGKPYHVPTRPTFIKELTLFFSLIERELQQRLEEQRLLAANPGVSNNDGL